MLRNLPPRLDSLTFTSKARFLQYFKQSQRHAHDRCARLPHPLRLHTLASTACRHGHHMHSRCAEDRFGQNPGDRQHAKMMLATSAGTLTCHASSRTCTSKHTHAQQYTYLYIYTYIYIGICLYTCIYILVRTYILNSNMTNYIYNTILRVVLCIYVLFQHICTCCNHTHMQ